MVFAKASKNLLFTVYLEYGCPLALLCVRNPGTVSLQAAVLVSGALNVCQDLGQILCFHTN